MDFVRQLLGVGCVLALLLALVWMQRKKGALLRISANRGKNKTLEVVERLPLTPHHALYLLRVGETTLLLGVHNSGFAVLSDDRPSRPAKA